MKPTFILILLSFLLLSNTCNKKTENCHKAITFINNSDKELYVTRSWNYPDTISFAGIPNPALDPNFSKVNSHEKNTRALWGRDCYEVLFGSELYNYQDTLMVFVFDAQVLENTDWETVKQQYLILKRYDLSLEDLRNMDWTIEYP